jgi:hypothetical protein
VQTGYVCKHELAVLQCVYLNTKLGAMDNRLKMKELCDIAGSYPVAAKLISEATMRPLSVDAIKSWTCDPESSRARPCPDWAVQALQLSLDKK